MPCVRAEPFRQRSPSSERTSALKDTYQTTLVMASLIVIAAVTRKATSSVWTTSLKNTRGGKAPTTIKEECGLWRHTAGPYLVRPTLRSVKCCARSAPVSRRYVLTFETDKTACCRAARISMPTLLDDAVPATPNASADARRRDRPSASNVPTTGTTVNAYRSAPTERSPISQTTALAHKVSHNHALRFDFDV